VKKRKLSESPYGRKPKRRDRSKIVVTARDRRAGGWFAKLVALQTRLLGPGGCPWDREQTHTSLRKYLIEETYEVLEALESKDDAELSSELGDLLLQIVFHSRLAEQERRFSIDDVIEAIYTKMIRRHPHVFGDASAPDSKAVLRNWEEIKAGERAAKKTAAANSAQSESIIGGVPRAMPGVLEAYQLTRKAAKVGFDWDNLDGIFDKIDEERRELLEVAASARQSASAKSRTEEEVGDFLFAAANVARFLGIDPELALKRANRKFRDRFEWMERAAKREGKHFADLPRDRKEELWNEAKQASRKPAAD
jgi:tetrapyrrole methylase family protein / MazG family protein